MLVSVGGGEVYRAETLLYLGHPFTPQRGGTTDIDYVVVREGKNLQGQVLRLVLRSGGKRSLKKALDTTVKAIEARA